MKYPTKIFIEQGVIPAIFFLVLGLVLYSISSGNHSLTLSFALILSVAKLLDGSGHMMAARQQEKTIKNLNFELSEENLRSTQIRQFHFNLPIELAFYLCIYEIETLEGFLVRRKNLSKGIITAWKDPDANNPFSLIFHRHDYAKFKLMRIDDSATKLILTCYPKLNGEFDEGRNLLNAEAISEILLKNPAVKLISG